MMKPDARSTLLRTVLIALAAAALVATTAHQPIAARAAQAGSNTVVNPSLYQSLHWRNIGPARGGRVTAVAGVRTEPCTFYMGATGGGVWKTEDCGIGWTPVSDGQMSTPSIGAIAVADSDPNVVYVGTGSAAIRSNVILGRGMYKSTDAGKTWQFVGLMNAGQIGTVRVHPTNPDVAYAAALGNPFMTGPDRGVYRTRDGGKTWDKVLFINDETGAVSLAMDRSHPDVIYAGAWRGQRKPWTIISGGPATTGGIYKTTDGGDHWTHLTNGLPKDLIGKVWLDLAQSNPSVVYAMVEAPGDEGGLYRSSDAGATWTLVNNSTRLRARPFYFDYVYVNPKHENEVWVNELALHKSTDGGKAFEQVPTPHGDNQGMWFNPDDPQVFIESNDGGANITQNGGESWSSILNQPTGEFYMVDTDRQFPYRVYGPQQDNSTIVISSLPPFSWRLDDPTQVWGQASGCESGQIRAIPSGRIVYGDCKGEFGRYDVETGQEQAYWIDPQQRYGLDPKDQTYRFVRQAPIEVDPRDPDIVYHGAQYLMKTTDGGIHWQKISPDLTANDPRYQMHSGEPITRDVTGEEVYSALYAIRASRLEPGVIWTGSNDGPVWVTRDGGKTWKNVTPKGLPPGGRVHTIEDSPHRKGSAYVSVYRIYFGDFKPYLYMTNDYGEHWTLLTDGANGIPADEAMHVVREDPQVEGLLYAGTWYGAYVSFDQGRHWQSLQLNLPQAAVTDIKVHDDDLVISTMGRAFWILDDVAPLREIATWRRGTAPGGVPTGTFDPQATHLFKPASAYRMEYSPMSGNPDEPEYPPVGANIDYSFASAPAGEVTLDILDGGGQLVRHYSSEARRGGAPAAGGFFRRFALPTTLPKDVGLNRFVWDLRYPGGAGGFGGGPLAVPGTYTAKLTAGGETQTATFEVKIDPRVAKAGVTQADLVEQLQFALKVRAALSEAQQLADRLQAAMKARPADQAKLKAVYDKLVNQPPPYPANMLITQIQNVYRMATSADAKVGASAFWRFDQVMKDLEGIKAEATAAGVQ